MIKRIRNKKTFARCLRDIIMLSKLNRENEKKKQKFSRLNFYKTKSLFQ